MAFSGLLSVKTGKKGQNECPNLDCPWILPDTLPDTPEGQADTIWLRNQAMSTALHLQVVSTSATWMLLPSRRQLLLAIRRLQQAILPSNELLTLHPQRTADELKEHQSAASARTESDSDIEIVGCTSLHKRPAATSPKRPLH
jgi:hypothetical protein